MTGSITFRPIATCCSGIISQRSLAQAPWSAPCWRRKWVTFPARFGFSRASCSRVRSRT